MLEAKGRGSLGMWLAKSGSMYSTRIILITLPHEVKLIAPFDLLYLSFDRRNCGRFGSEGLASLGDGSNRSIRSRSCLVVLLFCLLLGSTGCSCVGLVGVVFPSSSGGRLSSLGGGPFGRIRERGGFSSSRRPAECWLFDSSRRRRRCGCGCDCGLSWS